ncbi:MAG: PAS domain S-box protein [Thermoplasmata archaeon]
MAVGKNIPAKESLQDAVHAELWEYISDAVICTDADFNITGWNRAAEEMYGWRAEEVTGENVHKVTGTEYPHDKREDVLEHLYREGHWKGEVIQRTKDGKGIHVSASVALVRGAEGDAIGTLAVSRDITEDKRLEKVLKKSEKGYRDLLENAPVGVYKTNLKGEILYVNRALARIFGFDSPEDMIHEGVLVRYEDPGKRKIILAILKEEGKVTDFDAEFISKNGEEKNVLLSATLNGDEISGTLIDITKRKEAEKKITHIHLVLRAIRSVNQLITTERNRDKLLKGVCDSLIENRGYFNAWIALLDEDGQFVKAEESGLGKDFEPILKKLKRGELISCGRSAMKKSGIEVIDNPFESCKDCPLSKTYEGRGAMTVRLEHQGKVYGLMTVSIPRDLVTDKEEQALFEEIVGDIAFALHTLEIEEGRKRFEEELRHSEEKYREMVDQAPDGMTTIDVKGKVTACNRAFLESTGFTEEEIVGQHFSKLPTLRTRDIPKYMKVFAALVMGKTPRPLEVTWVNRNGSEREVEVSISPMRKDGKVHAFQTIARDVTDRKRMSRALRESEEKYRLLVENANDGIVVVQNGLLKFSNPKVAEVTGYTMKELASKPFADLIYPEDQEMVLAHYKGRIKGKDVPNIYTFRVVGKHGNVIWVEINAVVFRWEGKPATLNFLSDVTARKRAEMKAKREALNLQYLYRAALEFTAFPQEDDIYEHIGKRLSEIAGDSIVLILSYDENAGVHEIRSVVGLGKLRRAITKLIGMDVVGMQFNALPGLYGDLKSGRLVKLSHGIHELTGGRISKRTSKALTKTAKIGDIHFVAIGRGETVFAHVAILTRRGTKLKNRILIETSAGQASMALQRRRATEELNRSKEMLVEAQRVAHVGNWSWNIQTDELTWSDEIFRIFGLNPREFGATYGAFLNSVHPDDIDLVQRSIDRALNERRPYGIDHRIVLPSGEVRFVHEEGEVIANEKGEPIEIIGTVQDITDRKEAEEQIKSSEERFRLVFEHAPDGYILKDLDGTTVDVNRSFAEMLGFEKDEWLGRRFGEMGILPKDEARRFAEVLGSVVEGKETSPREFTLIRRDGDHVQAEIREVPIMLGGQRMILGIVRDITEAKKAEQRLIRSEKLAGMGTLVSGIAHEINNPLAGVMGYAEAILDEDDPKLIKNHAQKIVDAAGGASEIVRWLSRYSREGMDLSMADLDLNDVVQGSLEAIRLTRKPQNIDIVADLGDVPPVEGNRHDLQQVFINLLHNSIDALENGGQIVLSTRDKGNLVEVEVSDTGVGIPEEQLYRIFDPFFTTKDVGKGTGLGLYIVSMIVKRHKGSIDVASSEGKGTTITLTFPAKNEESKDRGKA